VHAAVSEGFGNAVLEAQAAGLPVVCTDAEGLTENVEADVTGLVVARRDPAALAAAILRLARDPEQRVAMGEAGHRRARERFRLADQRAAFAAFFREVAG
jgi:glycosyltransferase involved in cell wall biosynthesis